MTLTTRVMQLSLMIEPVEVDNLQITVSQGIKSPCLLGLAAAAQRAHRALTLRGARRFAFEFRASRAHEVSNRWLPRAQKIHGRH